MGHRVRLVVPSDNEAELGPILGRIIGHWGGCTLLSGKGFWSDKDGVIVQDVLSVLEVSIPLWDQAASEWFSDLADVVRKEWDQDSVYLSVQEEAAIFIGRDGFVEVMGL